MTEVLCKSCCCYVQNHSVIAPRQEGRHFVIEACRRCQAKGMVKEIERYEVALSGLLTHGCLTGDERVAVRYALGLVSTKKNDLTKGASS